jgi:enterochelin esterase-like enzyme
MEKYPASGWFRSAHRQKFFKEACLKYRLVVLAVLVGLALGACTRSSEPISVDTAFTVPEATPRLATKTPTSTPPNIPTLSPTLTPSFTPTSTPQECLFEGGTVTEDKIKSSLLEFRLQYYLYLPPCYEENTSQRYPVLYLIHGQSYNHFQWVRLGAPEMADAMIASGDLPPFIIVMPRDIIWVEPTGDNFGKAIIQDLIPFIDSQYRTLPDRGFRAIGGLSRGASWALHLGFSNWELFSAIGGHSLPVFFEDVRRVPGWLESIPPEMMPRIWVDVGEGDNQTIINSSTWFGGKLDEYDIPHEWYLFKGFHDEEYWSSHLPGADSEKVVASDHDAFDYPDAIDEIKRVLTLP